MNHSIGFTILITTKNRLEALKITLLKIADLLNRNDVSCMIFDDGSTDGTSNFIKNNYPNIQLLRNQKSKGLIYCRNILLSKVTSDYAISIDDDLHFLSESPLELITQHFNLYPKCAVVSFSVFWGIEPPSSILSKEQSYQTQSFLGGAHAWRMKAWQTIPDYPYWFVFYGEEDFASYQLFKNGWQVHYLPQIVTHHRVDIKNRKKATDYLQRARRSLRADWFLYFLFVPNHLILRKMAYSIWMQFKLKTLKGDWKTTIAIILALFDIFSNSVKIYKNKNKLNTIEYEAFLKLPETKIYWFPDEFK